MIISDRAQGVSPSKLSGQGGHAHEPLVPVKMIRKAAQKQKFWPCVPNRHLHCTIRRTMTIKTKCRISRDQIEKIGTTNVLVEIESDHHCCVYHSILTWGKGASRCRSPTCQDSWWLNLKMLSREKSPLTKLMKYCSHVQPTWPCARGSRRWRSRTREARVQPWRNVKCAPASLSLC